MTPCGVSLKTIFVSFCPLARVRGAFWLALPRGGQDCGTNPFLAATKLYRPGSTSLKRKYPALSVVVPYGTVFRWSSGCRVRYVFLRGSPLVALKKTYLTLQPLDQRNTRSEEHTSELQSLTNLVCRLLLDKKKMKM